MHVNYLEKGSFRKREKLELFSFLMSLFVEAEEWKVKQVTFIHPSTSLSGILLFWDNTAEGPII